MCHVCSCLCLHSIQKSSCVQWSTTACAGNSSVTLLDAERTALCFFFSSSDMQHTNTNTVFPFFPQRHVCRLCGCVLESVTFFFTSHPEAAACHVCVLWVCTVQPSLLLRLFCWRLHSMWQDFYFFFTHQQRNKRWHNSISDVLSWLIIGRPLVISCWNRFRCMKVLDVIPTKTSRHIVGCIWFYRVAVVVDWFGLFLFIQHLNLSLLPQRTKTGVQQTTERNRSERQSASSTGLGSDWSSSLWLSAWKAVSGFLVTIFNHLKGQWPP